MRKVSYKKTGYDFKYIIADKAVGKVENSFIIFDVFVVDIDETFCLEYYTELITDKKYHNENFMVNLIKIFIIMTIFRNKTGGIL